MTGLGIEVAPGSGEIQWRRCCNEPSSLSFRCTDAVAISGCNGCTRTERDKAQAQHFVCHTGFTLAQCQSRMRILRRVLNRYHADELGEWSWVLVRTTDWEELLSVRGFDARTPAFTYLPANETFFDDALTTSDSIRGLQLTMFWQMPSKNYSTRRCDMNSHMPSAERRTSLRPGS